MTLEPVKSGVSGRLNALLSLRKSTSGIHPDDEEKRESGRLAKALQGFMYKERTSPYALYPRTWKDMFACQGQKSVAPVVRDLMATMSPRSMAVVMEKKAATRRAMSIQRVVEDENDGVTMRECSLFDSARDDALFTQSWTPVSVKVRGVVLVLHGLNEHSGRYNDFAKQLNANGFKVYGMDWIGHGGSDGLHGYVQSLDYAVADMKMFLRRILIENDGLPCFCFGHSTGGAIVLKAALDPEVEHQVAGIVLTSPAVGVQPSHPIFALAPVMSFLLPKYQVKTANKNGKPVCRDPEALVAKYSDPLVYTGPLRVKTGYEILKVTSYLQQNLNKLKVPFLVLHGMDDTLTDPKASQKLYDEASSTDKTIRLFEGLLHDLLFELEREAITDDIIQWLNFRV